MKVIFIKDLKKQGKKGDIKEEKDGYANFLINNGYAVKATQTSLNRLNDEIAIKQIEDTLEIKEMTKIKEKLEKEKIIFKVKTGEAGKVFGQISSKQIKEKLAELGYQVKKQTIKLDTPLTTLGFHNVEIELHKKVTANIKIQIVSR